MVKNISRRFFIGGLAGTAALGPRHLFAAKPGAFAAGRPALTFGVVSDVHISLADASGRLSGAYDTRHLEKAFAHFRDSGADAVVIAGDMAHCGLFGELKAVADAWYRVFPNDRAPDGRKVERVFVFGNHDWSGLKRGKRVYPNADELRKQVLALDPKRFWDECFHEEWREFYTREVKGYRFVGAQWCKGTGEFGDCNGTSETFIAGLAERYAALKGKIDPSRPFFHVQHPHPRGTVHGETVWGQDDGESVKALSAYPNAISFSGHSHTSLLDEKSVWQGAFTAVGTATLRNVGLDGFPRESPLGFENYSTPRKDRGLDALKVMPVIDRFACKQGQLVRVYDDRVVFSHRDFVNDLALEDDLVMPLPAAESKPFAFASRAAAARAPEFASGATVAVRTVTAKARAAKKGAPAKKSVELVFPPALAVPAARCVTYEIVAKGTSGADLKASLAAETCRFAATSAQAKADVKCRLAVDRLPKGPVTFTVTPRSCWGKAGKPLVAAYAPR